MRELEEEVERLVYKLYGFDGRGDWDNWKWEVTNFYNKEAPAHCVNN